MLSHDVAIFFETKTIFEFVCFMGEQGMTFSVSRFITFADELNEVLLSFSHRKCISGKSVRHFLCFVKSRKETKILLILAYF